RKMLVKRRQNFNFVRLIESKRKGSPRRIRFPLAECYKPDAATKLLFIVLNDSLRIETGKVRPHNHVLSSPFAIGCGNFKNKKSLTKRTPSPDWAALTELHK